MPSLQVVETEFECFTTVSVQLDGELSGHEARLFQELDQRQ